MFGKKMTPANGTVNVNRFTIYAMIPGLDAYVAAKLDKKKFANIYTIIFMVSISALTAIVMYQMSIDPELDMEMDKIEKADRVYGKFMPQLITVILGSLSIHIPIYTYLIRKWAKEWNMKFESESH